MDEPRSRDRDHNNWGSAKILKEDGFGRKIDEKPETECLSRRVSRDAKNADKLNPEGMCHRGIQRVKGVRAGGHLFCF